MRPNILIIVLDAVRAQNVGCYGHSRPTTPAIDAIADDGIRFERAVSPASVTLDSVTSMLAGEYPGAHQSGRIGKMNAKTPLLPEILSNTGYTTGMVTCNPFITPAFGFTADRFYPVTHRFTEGINVRKFFSETKHLSLPHRYYRFFKTALRSNFLKSVGNALQFKFGIFEGQDDGAVKATKRTREIIRDATRPWWLYLHYTETHMNSADTLPYAIPDAEKSRFLDITLDEVSGIQTTGGQVEYNAQTKDTHERLYDAAIRYLDGQIAQIKETLEETGAWDETLLIITADHGELIGEHGQLGHGELYEPGIHVPLIIKPPGEHSPKIVQQRVNTLWLYRTILEIAGTESLPGTGVNLLNTEEIASKDVLTQDYTSTWEWSRYRSDGEGSHAFYTDENKLISGSNRTELYNLRRDPDEADNIATERPEILAEMKDRLGAKLGEINEPDTNRHSINFDNATETRLKDLGYLE